jgi:formimidoylglutamate deiminase
MLAAGFTHLAEFHYLLHGVDGVRGREMTDAVVRAAGEAGLPITLLPVYYRTSGFDGSAALPEQHRFVHDSVQEYLEMLSDVRDVAGGAAPHSLRAVPPRDLPELVAGVDDILGPEAPLHIHVSEQSGEVDECLERFGATPIDLLFDHVDAGPRWNLVHATHATGGEREAVRSAGATVVLCPLTESYLGDGVFEAREHASAGGAMAVGTDSNVRISAIEELRTLEYGQRLRDRMRARLGTEAGVGAPLWALMAAGGAAASGVPGGAIAAGSRADFAVLDGESPTFAGHDPETALDAWLVGGDASDLAATYVAGRRVVDHGVSESDADARARFVSVMKKLGARPDA